MMSDTDTLSERRWTMLLEDLERGVVEVGLHEDNETSLYAVDDATDVMLAGATKLRELRTALDAANATIERLREALDQIAEEPRIPLSEAEASPVVFAALNARVVRARKAQEPTP